MRRWLAAFALGVAVGPGAAAGPIAPPAPGGDEAMFPFVIPWDDAVQGTATDVSALNRRPAGAGGFVVVCDGVFVAETTGERLRFFATNLAGRAAFPPKEDADRIAARMAKLGINLVRLHHLQNSWEKPGGTIWKGKPFVEVDPAQVDTLDRLVAALKRHGIYTNLNLSTTREYVPELGFPPSVRDIAFPFDKKVDEFDRRMIELQKEYARALLGHVNAYTGLAYRDEPALAFVEINNENSLVGWPHESPGEGLDALPDPFHAQIVTLWNTWLSGKYGDDAALRAAWSGGGAEPGASLVTKDSAWRFENQAAPEAAAHEIVPSTSAGEGTGGIRLVVRKPLGGEWLVQGLLPSLTLQEGELYTLRFRAKADPHRVIGVKVHLDRPDWQEHGLRAQARLGADWREFVYAFRARSVVPAHSRIAFLAGGEPATIEIEAVTLRPGAAPWEPPPGQSLLRRNLGLGTDAFHGRRLSDWMLFLLQSEKAYAEEMRSFLREDLKVRANLIDTQIQWGRLAALERESSMEYADAHAYWQHPEFTGSGWDSVNWFIRRRAHVNVMDSDQGVLADLALHRVAGRPYTVSEYNHPAPNDYQSEMMPLLATFAALQDWDAFYTFAYPPTGRGEDNEALEGFFDVGINPAKAAFYPSTALMFRRGLVAPLAATDTLRVPPRSWETFGSAPDAWERTGGRPDLLKVRVALGEAALKEARREPATAGPAAGAPAPAAVTVRRNARGATYIVDAPAAKAAAGFVGGETLALGDVTLSFPSFGRGGEGFAALTLVDLDGRALATTDRALLTLVGRAENRGMGWNADRTSVGDRWGEGPVMAEGIPCQVSLRASGHRVVWALDGSGQRRERVPAVRRSGTVVFRADPRYRTVWYEIADR